MKMNGGKTGNLKATGEERSVIDRNEKRCVLFPDVSTVAVFLCCEFFISPKSPLLPKLFSFLKLCGNVISRI
jgi:hypothetical protein